MSASVQVGLLLALLCAFTSIVGFLYKHRGAVESPPIELRRPISSSLALFKSRWYLLGIAIALGSWGLHVGALALAPISIVQTVIAGGLVLLTVVANRMFGFSVSRREWVGVALTATGLAFLAATLQGAADSAHSDFATTTLVAYVGGLSTLGVLAAVAGRATPRGASFLAVSAGLIWGASDVSIKALSGNLDQGVLAVLVHPLVVVIFVASAVGFAISGRSLQIGRAVPVIATTSAAANVCTILAGPVVFGEPLPDEPAALMLRVLAFALVIVAAALTPPPVREPEPSAAIG
ncbi:MAG: DMT family transporter [Thermoleophilaceae bacterium]